MEKDYVNILKNGTLIIQHVITEFNNKISKKIWNGFYEIYFF